MMELGELFFTQLDMCARIIIYLKYELVEDGSILYIKCSFTIHVKGEKIIELEFISGMIPTLNDIYYVPEVRKNLMFGSLFA